MNQTSCWTRTHEVAEDTSSAGHRAERPRTQMLPVSAKAVSRQPRQRNKPKVTIAVTRAWAEPKPNPTATKARAAVTRGSSPPSGKAGNNNDTFLRQVSHGLHFGRLLPSCLACASLSPMQRATVRRLPVTQF